MTYGEATLIILAVMSVAGAGVVGVRRVVTLETLQKHHEIGVAIFLQIGVMYAVLLAFVVSVVWSQFNEAAKAVDREAAELTTVFHLARGLPDPIHERIQRRILTYAGTVVNDEWQTMNVLRESAVAHAALDELWNTWLDFTPRTAQETALYAESLQRLGNARENRRIRLFQMTLAAPGFLWALLLIVGAMVIGLSYFFGIEYVGSQVVMTAS
ncbi:MAG: DUF4239 domain-containing protein, partial [Gammaproteobacteria bacterium]